MEIRNSSMPIRNKYCTGLEDAIDSDSGLPQLLEIRKKAVINIPVNKASGKMLRIPIRIFEVRDTIRFL